MSSFEEELEGLERDFSQLKEDYDRCIGHETLKSVMQIGKDNFPFGQSTPSYSDLLQMQKWDWRNWPLQWVMVMTLGRLACLVPGLICWKGL